MILIAWFFTFHITSYAGWDPREWKVVLPTHAICEASRKALVMEQTFNAEGEGWPVTTPCREQR